MERSRLDKIVALIDEAKKIKYCLVAGAYEMAYEHTQNLEDELTTVAIKELIASETQEKTSTQPPQRVEV